MAKAYVKYSLIGAKSSERPSPLLNQLTVHYHDKGFCKISVRFVKDSLSKRTKNAQGMPNYANQFCSMEKFEKTITSSNNYTYVNPGKSSSCSDCCTDRGND